ncbi:hypothetical protein [Mucilaginibacter sp. R-33]|uniref:hypothetical protein n=2 Tax=unclassified Mucilaginibacter TaxID=2617802 RepID=UPI003CFA5AD6
MHSIMFRQLQVRSFRDLADGKSSKASFSVPYGLAVDAGKVYIADTFNNLKMVIAAQ